MAYRGGGFEYFYGFIGGEANQWYPSLYEGTTPVEVKKTPEEGYHLMEDMTDKAVNWIGQQKALIPDKALLRLLRTGRGPRPAPRPQGMDRQVQGQVRPGLGQATRGDICTTEETGRDSTGLPAYPEAQRNPRMG